LPYNAPIPLFEKNMHYTKPPEMAHLWPAYFMRRRPFLVHLVFSNEKACSENSFSLPGQVFLPRATSTSPTFDSSGFPSLWRRISSLVESLIVA